MGGQSEIWGQLVHKYWCKYADFRLPFIGSLHLGALLFPDKRLQNAHKLNAFLEFDRRAQIFLETAVTHDHPAIRHDALGVLRAAIEAYPAALARLLSNIVPRLFQVWSSRLSRESQGIYGSP